MNPFRLDQHRRAWPQPLSAPPADYFAKLPTRIMARVAPPAAAGPAWLGWLSRGPAALRTGLASTLLLGAFAASFWLGQAGPRPELTAPGLDQVPQAELVEYLLTGEARVEPADMAELPAHPLGITNQFLRPSAQELTEAFDAQPAEN